MPRGIVRRNDLVKARDAVMAIIQDSVSSPADIVRACRVLIQLKQLELRMESGAIKPPAGRQVEPPKPIFDGEPLVYSLDHLTRNA